MARLDKNFNQINATLNAFTNDATTYKPNVLQIDDYVAIGRAYIPTITNTTAGWYRLADIDATGLPTSMYPQLLIMAAGTYTNGIPSEFALTASLPSFGNNANARVMQLVGHAGQNYTEIRFGNDGRNYHVEIYLAQTGASSRGRQEFFIASVGGKLTTYAPTSPISENPANLIITFPLVTTKTSAVNTVLQARAHVTGISSLAALKNQLSTWYATQGASSIGYYTMALSGTISPITPTSASLGVEIRATATTNNGTAILTTHSTNGGALYIMAFNNGTWTDPVRIS